MKNIKKVAMAVATAGAILFAGSGVASADPLTEGASPSEVTNVNKFSPEDSIFCGTQIETHESEQNAYCPFVNVENLNVIFT